MMGSSRLGLLACLLLLSGIAQAQVNPFLFGEAGTPAVRDSLFQTAYGFGWACLMTHAQSVRGRYLCV